MDCNGSVSRNAAERGSGKVADLAQAKGLFFRTRREEGRAVRMRAQAAMTRGVILARLLNDPNVTKPAAAAGAGSTGGASMAGV